MLQDPRLTRIFAFLTCAGLFILCDALAANWGKNNSTPSLIALLLFSPIAYVAFGYLNQKHALAIVSAWVVLAVCISSVLMGIFIFGDKLSIAQGIGLVLSIFAVGLMLFS